MNISAALRKYTFTFSLFVVWCLFYSCASIQPVEFRRVEKLDMTEKEGKSSALVQVSVYNPNSIGVSLRELNTELSMDNHILGKGRLDESHHIRRKSESKLTFLIPTESVNFGGMLSLGMQLFSGEKKEAVLRGKFKLSKSLWSKSYSFELKKNVDKDVLKEMMNLK